jgi:hypothetical protein
MLGFKRFHTAAVAISGIELAAKIRKHQFKVGKLSGRRTTIPTIWAVVVAAQLRPAIRQLVDVLLRKALVLYGPEQCTRHRVQA